MAIVSTGTLTVNAAFFQEIKEVHHELWCLLAKIREMCQQPDQVLRQGGRLADLFECLRDQLALHFALEEAYGYFEDPVHVAPRLCDRAFSLREEHCRLYVKVTTLEQQVREVLDRPTRARLLALINDFDEFDRQFQAHEEQENELILQEYSDDIGVGD